MFIILLKHIPFYQLYVDCLEDVFVILLKNGKFTCCLLTDCQEIFVILLILLTT